ncbi:MAG: hypothetical protein GXP31_12590 [Kiritimatiellaeota bacterium]|nr:hypothetical protein [Kiritimatiellota bacterium]
MKWFLGQYEYVLDRQRRVAIPSAWREADRSKNRFILMPGPNRGIHVIPASMFEELVQKLRRAPFGDAKVADALAFVGSKGHDSTCDTQGRISLTPQLMEHAGLEPQAKVVLVGGITTIQVFAPANWQARPKDQDESLNVLQQASGPSAGVAEMLRDLFGGPAPRSD